jgi:hypothetical protein
VITHNRYWKKDIARDRKTFVNFLREDIVAKWELKLRSDEVTVGMAGSLPIDQLEYATEIGFADPSDPLILPFVDRALGICGALDRIGHWGQWGNNDVMSVSRQKGLTARCQAYAQWLKTGSLDFALLREAYTQLRIALQRLVEDPSYEWDDLKEALHLSALLLLEILGPEGAGLEPPPKRPKAKELPEEYFLAIEGLRKKNATDPEVWKAFSTAFEVLRDPKLKAIGQQLRCSGWSGES